MFDKKTYIQRREKLKKQVGSGLLLFLGVLFLLTIVLFLVIFNTIYLMIQSRVKKDKLTPLGLGFTYTPQSVVLWILLGRGAFLVLCIRYHRVVKGQKKRRGAVGVSLKPTAIWNAIATIGRWANTGRVRLNVLVATWDTITGIWSWSRTNCIFTCCTYCIYTKRDCLLAESVLIYFSICCF